MKLFVASILIFCTAFLFGLYILPFLMSQKANTQLPASLLDNSNPVSSSQEKENKQEKEEVYLDDFRGIRENLISEKKDFLEANLQAMKVMFYKDGSLGEETLILAKGDPQSWGGSAVGLYQVISKSKISYSSVSECYMPYAIHYYGKYYFHGEPYYPGGGKYISEFSGGCVRLLDKDAENIYRSAEEGIPILVIDKENDNYKYSQEKLTKFPEVSAQSYVVADLGSGFVFAENNSQKKLSIASLTKLMTALIVAENINLERSILVKKDMLSAYGSTKGLDAGRIFRVVELFYPLLVESSNDAAEVLSRFLGREKTITLMNEKSKSILMENTSFVDPHGLDVQNISTAQDLFYLARYILNNRPTLLKISQGEKVWNFGFPINFKNLENRNIFYEDPNFIGGKTGYIYSSKHVGLFIFQLPLKEEGRRNIAVILLGSTDLQENNPEILEKDVKKVLNWLKENYFAENQ